MKIDLPVTIIFDCEDFRSGHGCHTKNFIPRVCTLRFESDDLDGPVELFTTYPPEKQPGYPSCENGEGVLAVLTSDEYRHIVARAERNPYDYGVGTEEEREAAQAAADELAAQDGPND